ncbi:hypothetical protein [Pseudofrankia asymbiotica]|uniref:DUF2202 domain-containing protein n=1 Tax=Pseudofrankia asymbiotica TaxID=1834516 RepID=A0A1V2IDH5_9ACTN|nr:hypothetical protein [Pseudofrankia asymbiotica]ONH31248.1 hypothetical protein BL253_10305 [Pseudofrankia asymbiotica]
MGGVGVRGAPSRRAVLALPAAGVAAAGLVTTAGCTESRPAGAPAPPPVDLAAARAAARTERDLLVDYDAAIARHPALAALLGGLRAHHAQHLAALTTQVPALATATPDGVASGGGPSVSAPATPSGAATAPAAGASPPGSAGAQPGADDSPAARASALAELATAERTAADEHRASCLTATGGLAPLLASLRAAESCHADLLSLAGSAG